MKHYSKDFHDFLDEEKLSALINDIYERRAKPKIAARLLSFIAYLKKII